MILFLIIFSIYLFLFWISIRIKDNSIVDIFWWTGFVIISAYLYFLNNNFDIFHTLVLILISFWWLRLSYYILNRKLKEKKEDRRYNIWRKTWKYFYIRSFFQVYLLQMILMFIISTTIFIIFYWDITNIYFFIFWFLFSIIWLVFEVVSDLQVQEYIKQNWKNNKVFTKWLYKYSRNPNYFWESLFWFWLSIIWLSISIFSLVWFITITLLLLFVSWVPLKEKRQSSKDNRESYKNQTSIFIPWFKKK